MNKVKIFIYFTIIFLGFFGGISFASAATYYVSNSGTASWTQCVNIDTPCAVQTAFDNAVAGDITYFRGGTYNVPAKNFGTTYHGYYEPVNSGTVSNPITFAAYSGEIPIFNGTAGGSGDVTDFATIFGTWGRSYIVFDGFKFQSDNGVKMARIHIGSDDRNFVSVGIIVKNCDINGGSTAIATQDNRETLRVDYADDVLIQNCKLYNARSTNNYLGISGMKSYFTTNMIVENCEIYNTESALYPKSDTEGAIFRYNWIHDNRIGIYITTYYTSKAHNANNMKIYNNVIANSWYSAIHNYGQNVSSARSDDMEIYNNTIYSNQAGTVFGIFYSMGERFKLHSNIIQGHESDQYSNGYDVVTVSESDYNNFGSYTFRIITHLYFPSNIYNSLSAWQASTELIGSLNPDTHSLASNPLFQNGSGTLTQLNDFLLASNSPSKGTGKNGADMGADISLVGVQSIVITDTVPPSAPTGLVIQ